MTNLPSASVGKALPGPRRDGIQGLSGWRVQKRVVSALTYRELRTRISEVRGGFFGVMLQPLGQIAILVLFLTALTPNRGGSLNVVLFLASGTILFSIFSQITSRSMNAMKANAALLFYKPVKPVDAVISRAICETGILTCCFLLVLAGTWIYLDQIVMDDLGLFFVSLSLAIVLGFSTGLVFMTANYLVPWFAPIGSWVPRILWILSGVSFRYWLFPAWTKPLFIWNPLLHCIELNRSSMTQNYFTPDASLTYAFNSTAIFLTFSLWVYFNNEKKLLTR
jgi:capsular polysaccharide transport system permease protein